MSTNASARGGGAMSFSSESRRLTDKFLQPRSTPRACPCHDTEFATISELRHHMSRASIPRLGAKSHIDFLNSLDGTMPRGGGGAVFFPGATRHNPGGVDAALMQVLASSLVNDTPTVTNDGSGISKFLSSSSTATATAGNGGDYSLTSTSSSRRRNTTRSTTSHQSKKKKNAATNSKTQAMLLAAADNNNNNSNSGHVSAGVGAGGGGATSASSVAATRIQHLVEEIYKDICSTNCSWQEKQQQQQQQQGSGKNQNIHSEDQSFLSSVFVSGAGGGGGGGASSSRQRRRGRRNHNRHSHLHDDNSDCDENSKNNNNQQCTFAKLFAYLCSRTRSQAQWTYLLGNTRELRSDFNVYCGDGERGAMSLPEFCAFLKLSSCAPRILAIAASHPQYTKHSIGIAGTAVATSSSSSSSPQSSTTTTTQSTNANTNLSSSAGASPTSLPHISTIAGGGAASSSSSSPTTKTTMQSAPTSAHYLSPSYTRHLLDPLHNTEHADMLTRLPDEIIENYPDHAARARAPGYAMIEDAASRRNARFCHKLRRDAEEAPVDADLSAQREASLQNLTRMAMLHRVGMNATGSFRASI